MVPHFPCGCRRACGYPVTFLRPSRRSRTARVDQMDDPSVSAMRLGNAISCLGVRSPECPVRTQKNHPPRLYRKVIFMELIARFELATSSLPTRKSEPHFLPIAHDCTGFARQSVTIHGFPICMAHIVQGNEMNSRCCQLNKISRNRSGSGLH